MSAPRVLLVDALDAAGADAADARSRCGALRSLGAVVRLGILGPGRGRPDPEAVLSTPGAVGEWDWGVAGRAALRVFARLGRFDLALVATAAPGGGWAARALPPDLPARWWPTGLAGAAGWWERLPWARGGALEPLAVPANGLDPKAPPGLVWSTIDGHHSVRGRLTLWDGDYLLATPPAAAGDAWRVATAFAALAARRSDLELVVLGEPGSPLARAARARGVGTRVHFVGEPPREAEWAWWAHAAGALIADPGALAGGFVLRGLSAGCPLLVLPGTGPTRALAGWLARAGCTPWAREFPADPSAALATMLAGGALVEEARARGRALAARHVGRLLTARLAAALPDLGSASGRSCRAVA